MAIFVPWILWGVCGSLQNIVNAPLRWLSDENQALVDYSRFVSTFDTLETITISWPGCTLQNPQLKDLVNELRSDGRSPSGQRFSEYIKDVITVDSLIESLANERRDVSEKQIREEVTQRLKGTLVGRDGNTTCALVILTIKGSSHGAATIETLLETAEKTVGRPREEFRLAGSTVDGVAIDSASNHSLIYFALSMIFSVLICWYCLRSALFTLNVIAVAGFGAGVAFAMVYSVGSELSAVLMVMAPLAFVLTISAGVHLVNYYHDEVRFRGRDNAARRALLVGWQPCALAAATTSIGLASLMVSEIRPVFYFGMISTVAVSVTVVLLLLTLPGTMEIWDRRSSKTDSNATHPPDLPRIDVKAASFFGSHSMSITIVFIAVMVFSSFGLPKVTTSVNVTDLLSPRSKTIRDYQWMEHTLGPLIPVEVLVRFEPSCMLTTVQRVELLQQVERRIRDEIAIALESRDGSIIVNKTFTGGDAQRVGSIEPGDEIVSLGEGAEGEMFVIYDVPVEQVERWLIDREAETIRMDIRHEKTDEIQTYTFARSQVGIMSAASFVPRIPPPRRVAVRAALNVMLTNDKPGFIQTGMLAESDQEETWRISVRVPVFGEHDYGALLDELRERVEPVLSKYREAGFDGIEATYTGLTPVVHEAEHALLSDLMVSFLTATGLVLIVMIAVIRNVFGGILVMLPNVFPALLLFGSMGWLGQSVDIGTVMTASVALGIAVDDTLHFLTWFRRELDNGNSPQLAVAKTMQHCAKAMIQTTAICGLGLIVLALSGFIPTQRFALMMFALLTFALLGDLVLLPALLAGRAGQLFVTKRVEKQSATSSSPHTGVKGPTKIESSQAAEL